MQFAREVKPVEEVKLGVEKARATKGDKSETGKGKSHGEKLKYETKLTGEKIPIKGEKHGNEEESLVEREISEIEKGNLVERDKEKEQRGIQRVEEWAKDERIGDVIKETEYSFEDISFICEMQSHCSSSEDEEEVEEEEEQESIDREAAVQKYKSLQTECRSIVKKNNILLKKLAEHFKKRKMEHVYENPEPYSVEKEIRYHKQLLAFEEIRTTEKKEREANTKELKEMKKGSDELIAHLNVLIDSLIQKEREIGAALIDTKTGKVIPGKVVEELLSTQTRKLNELNEMRLTFIKLRDCVAAKKAQFQSLETFGENLHLTDYKRLQMANRSYADDTEKGEKELQYLRNKVTSAMQILAQLKEKSYAMNEEIDELHEVLKCRDSEVSNTRGYVTDLKKRRNFLRSESLRLHHEAGLLTQPCLLRDFAVSTEEAACLSMQLQNLKNSFYDQKQSLTKIRKSIDAHISNSSVRKENCVSSGTRHQRKQSHFAVFKEQEFPARYASHSKPQGFHPVTSNCIKQSSVAEVNLL